MTLSNLFIHGRQMELTDSIKSYTSEKISKIYKFSDNILKVDVTLSAAKMKTGRVHVAEILVYLSGKTIKSKASEDDLYYAIDKAVDSIEVQIKKYKDKTTGYNNKEKPTYHLYEGGSDPEEKKLIKVFAPQKPMEVSEAILQLESLNKLFIVFKNEATGKIAVVYKRKDGDYGYIDE